MSDTATNHYAAPPTEPEPHYMRSTGRIVATAARFIGYLVYIYILLVEIILFLGFFLLLFGANSSSGFVEWDGRDDEGRAVASGVYLLRATVDGDEEIRKVAVLRGGGGS